MSKANRSRNPKKTLGAVVVALGLTLAAGGVSAEEKAAPQYYLTALAGGSFATGDAGGATITGGDIMGASNADSAFGGAALGTLLDLGPVGLRLELEGTGGRSFRFTTPSANGIYVTDADVWTLQGNFWFEYSLGRLFPDMPVVRNVSAFGGGGVGVSGVTLSTTDGTAFGRSDSSKFAWQGGVGISYQPLPWLAVEARYQYIDMGGVSAPLASGAGPQGVLEMDLGANEVLGGVRLTFAGI